MKVGSTMKMFLIGGIHIPFFGVMIALGFIIAFLVIRYEAEEQHISADKMIDLSTWALLGGIVGGRIGYVLFYNFSFYIEHPIEIFKIYNGGLSIHGGIIGGAVAVINFLKRNREISLLQVADIVAPALILGQGIGRIGCDVYGKIMEQPQIWGVMVNGMTLHPAQGYEFILDYLLFGFLWIWRKKVKRHGEVFGIYLIGFAVIRGIVEVFRNNPRVFGVVSVSHLLSFALLMIGVFWLAWVKRKGQIIERIDVDSQCGLVVKTGMATIGMIVLSIFIYYSVQLNF